ncbi:MAG: hypothetical protein V9E89_13205 [Ilumatobacteraceae bacterium]
MLRLVLPKGSLEKATLELFEAADLPVVRSSSVDYKATIADPRIAEVRILRPAGDPHATWPRACSTSASPAVTGWRRPTSDVVSLGETEVLQGHVVTHPCGGGRGRRLARAQRIEDLPQGVRVSTEYPELTRRFFADRGHRG